MSVSLGVALNVAFDVALLAGLAFSMAQPRKLRPHSPARIVKQVSHEADVLLAQLQERYRPGFIAADSEQ